MRKGYHHLTLEQRYQMFWSSKNPYFFERIKRLFQPTCFSLGAQTQLGLSCPVRNAHVGSYSTLPKTLGLP